MQFVFRLFNSNPHYNLTDQAEHCRHMMLTWLQQQNLPVSHIISLSVFVNAISNDELKKKSELIASLLEKDIQPTLPLNFIAQPPADGLELSLEVHAVIEKNLKLNIIQKNISSFCYKVVNEQNTGKHLFIPGVFANYKLDGACKSSEIVFSILSEILHSEGMNFSHVYRQWNYIEHITEEMETAEGLKQNYQQFNDVRSEFYQQSGMNRYPAASGIGTSAGGINISLYAVLPENKIRLESIDNPLQVSAYKYSENVLVGTPAYIQHAKTTPKFSRAKYYGSESCQAVFISGTASIRGEETIAIGDAGKQTQITFENIEELVKAETLAVYGIEKPENNSAFDFFRVYIKNQDDFRQVETVCNHLYPDAGFIYVIADICRDNLLVEIETAIVL